MDCTIVAWLSCFPLIWDPFVLLFLWNLRCNWSECIRIFKNVFCNQISPPSSLLFFYRQNTDIDFLIKHLWFCRWEGCEKEDAMCKVHVQWFNQWCYMWTYPPYKGSQTATKWVYISRVRIRLCKKKTTCWVGVRYNCRKLFPLARLTEKNQQCC